jgi:hypothetical protein
MSTELTLPTTFRIPPKLSVLMASSSLTMTFLTSLICVVMWSSVVFVPAGKSSVEPPVWSGDKNDYSKLNFYQAGETYRQRMDTERRTIALQSCMQLAGVAFIFLALTLFLTVAGRGQDVLGRSPSITKNLELSVSGVVALICATLIFLYSSPQAAAPKQAGDAPAYAMPMMPSYAVPAPTPQL